MPRAYLRLAADVEAVADDVRVMQLLDSMSFPGLRLRLMTYKSRSSIARSHKPPTASLAEAENEVDAVRRRLPPAANIFEVLASFLHSAEEREVHH